jgi:hypothetical protein
MSQQSNTGHSIKNRDTAKNVFITPLDLAKSHIDMVDTIEGDLWLDSSKNSGSYYNQFPTDKKEYCEILEGIDFFNYTGSPDIICDNPPYSILDTWFKKVITLNPRVYACLIGVSNLTSRRIEWFEKSGYGIKKLKMLKVQKWYGMSYIVVFEKGADSIMEIDRKVYYTDEDKLNKEKKKKEKQEKQEKAKSNKVKVKKGKVNDSK